MSRGVGGIFLGRYRLTQSDACFKLGRDSVLLARFCTLRPGGRCVTWAVGWAPPASAVPAGGGPGPGGGGAGPCRGRPGPAEPVGQRLGGTSSYRRPPGPRPAEGRPLPAGDCQSPPFSGGVRQVGGTGPDGRHLPGGRPVPGGRAFGQDRGAFRAGLPPRAAGGAFAALRGPGWNPSGFSCCHMGPPAPLTRFWWRR